MMHNIQQQVRKFPDVTRVSAYQPSTNVLLHMAKKTEKPKRYIPLCVGQNVELRRDALFDGFVLKKGLRGVVIVPKLLNGNCVVDVDIVGKGVRGAEITRSNIRVLPSTKSSKVVRKPTAEEVEAFDRTFAKDKEAKRASRDSSALIPDMVTEQEFEKILDEHPPEREGTKWWCAITTATLNLLLREKIEKLFPDADDVELSIVWDKPLYGADGAEVNLGSTAKLLRERMLMNLEDSDSQDKELCAKAEASWTKFAPHGATPGMMKAYIAAYIEGAKAK